MTYEHQDYPKYLYHPKLAPEGKVFQSADETKGLDRKGWVDTPAKFPQTSRRDPQSILRRYRRLTFWNKLAVWGSLASIVGIGLYSWPFKRLDAPQQVAQVQGSQGTTIMQSGRDIVIYPAVPPGGPPPMSAPANGKPAAVTAQRVFTKRSLRDLMALYEGRTMLQADALIEPYKGLWISIKAEAVQIIPDTSGATVVLKSGTDLVNARFDNSWRKALARVNNGETITVRGRLSETQNGQQLYLMECEIGE